MHPYTCTKLSLYLRCMNLHEICIFYVYVEIKTNKKSVFYYSKENLKIVRVIISTNKDYPVIIFTTKDHPGYHFYK